MTGTSSPLVRIGKVTMAAALIALVGVSTPALSGQTDTATKLTRAQALKLARPLNDRGDPEIGNMPVVIGRSYTPTYY